MKVLSLGRFFATLTGLLWFGVLVNGVADTHYVAQGGQTPSGTYTNWGIAASNIQDAVDVSTAGDTVLVSNGVYETGGITNWPSGSALTNRVAITNAITVMSANNDPTNTIIKGRFHAGEPGAPGAVTNGLAAVRCVYMADNSKLIGFMLTNGATFADYPVTNYSTHSGGGVCCPTIYTPIISNCVLSGNSAYANGGGGAYYGTLYNCTLSGNSALISGGGGGAKNARLYNCLLTGNSAPSYGATYFCDLYNCTLSGNSASSIGSGGAVGNGNLYNCLLTGNSARDGAGAYAATMYNCTVISNSATRYGGGVNTSKLYNCIVYFNSAATAGSNWYATPVFTNSCTAPADAGWAAGNITDNPMFVNTNSPAANYRLAANSPCINGGTNYSWMTISTNVHSKDLDGRIRIRYGTADMGAYERLYNGTVFGVH